MAFTRRAHENFCLELTSPPARLQRFVTRFVTRCLRCMPHISLAFEGDSRYNVVVVEGESNVSCE